MSGFGIREYHQYLQIFQKMLVFILHILHSVDSGPCDKQSFVLPRRCIVTLVVLIKVSLVTTSISFKNPLTPHIRILDFVFGFVSGVFIIQKNIFIIMGKLVMPMMTKKSRLIFMLMTKIMSAEASNGLSFCFKHGKYHPAQTDS